MKLNNLAHRLMIEQVKRLSLGKSKLDGDGVKH
jgi:hypothetical protein